MKKFLLTIFTFMYMAMSSGIAMNVHYCMGKLAGVDFHNTADKPCGKCGMTEKQGKGCCKDEHKLIKLSADHTKAIFVSLHFPDLSAPILEIPVSPYQEELANRTAVQYYGAHSPPDIRLKRNILYSVFRI